MSSRGSTDVFPASSPRGDRQGRVSLGSPEARYDASRLPELRFVEPPSSSLPSPRRDLVGRLEGAVTARRWRPSYPRRAFGSRVFPARRPPRLWLATPPSPPDAARDDLFPPDQLRVTRATPRMLIRRRKLHAARIGALASQRALVTGPDFLLMLIGRSPARRPALDMGMLRPQTTICEQRPGATRVAARGAVGNTRSSMNGSACHQ